LTPHRAAAEAAAQEFKAVLLALRTGQPAAQEEKAWARFAEAMRRLEEGHAL